MTAEIPAGQMRGEYAVAMVEQHKVRWDRSVRVIIDRPTMLACLIAQQVGDLVTITCPSCDGEGVAHLTSTSGYKTPCRECWGQKTIQVPAIELDGPA